MLNTKVYKLLDDSTYQFVLLGEFGWFCPPLGICNHFQQGQVVVAAGVRSEAEEVRSGCLAVRGGVLREGAAGGNHLQVMVQKFGDAQQMFLFSQVQLCPELATKIELLLIKIVWNFRKKIQYKSSRKMEATNYLIKYYN